MRFCALWAATAKAWDFKRGLISAYFNKHYQSLNFAYSWVRKKARHLGVSVLELGRSGPEPNCFSNALEKTSCGTH